MAQEPEKGNWTHNKKCADMYLQQAHWALVQLSMATEISTCLDVQSHFPRPLITSHMMSTGVGFVPFHCLILLYELRILTYITGLIS